MSATESVIRQVAEIIGRVGDRDQVVEEVAGSVKFSKLASDLVKIDGPVREAAARKVAKIIDDYDPDVDDHEIGNDVIDGINFRDVAVELCRDPEVVGIIKEKAKAALRVSDRLITTTVQEMLGLTDARRLVQIIGQDDREELNRGVVGLVKSHVAQLKVADLGSGARQNVEAAVFTPERLEAALSGVDSRVNDSMAQFAAEVIRNADPNDSDDVLCAMVVQSPRLKEAVDQAVGIQIRTREIDDLVTEVLEFVLKNEGTPLRERIKGLIASKVADLVAGEVAARLFGGTGNPA